MDQHHIHAVNLYKGSNRNNFGNPQNQNMNQSNYSQNDSNKDFKSNKYSNQLNNENDNLNLSMNTNTSHLNKSDGNNINKGGPNNPSLSNSSLNYESRCTTNNLLISS